MATRSASVAPGAAVDITAALSLESGTGYLIAVGPDARSTDVVLIALGDDPETVGGHALDAGGRERFIRQADATWFARFYEPGGRSTQLTATEANDCA